MGDEKPDVASIYRKYAATISLLLGLLSVTTCLVSMIRDWLPLALFGLVVGLISLWISRDVRKRMAESVESGRLSGVPEKHPASSSLFSGNTRFSPILIFVLVLALGCVMAMIIFMKNLLQ